MFLNAYISNDERKPYSFLMNLYPEVYLRYFYVDAHPLSNLKWKGNYPVSMAKVTDPVSSTDTDRGDEGTKMFAHRSFIIISTFILCCSLFVL